MVWGGPGPPGFLKRSRRKECPSLGSIRPASPPASPGRCDLGSCPTVTTKPRRRCPFFWPDNSPGGGAAAEGAAPPPRAGRGGLRAASRGNSAAPARDYLAREALRCDPDSSFEDRAHARALPIGKAQFVRREYGRGFRSEDGWRLGPDRIDALAGAVPRGAGYARGSGPRVPPPRANWRAAGIPVVSLGRARPARHDHYGGADSSTPVVLIKAGGPARSCRKRIAPPRTG